MFVHYICNDKLIITDEFMNIKERVLASLRTSFAKYGFKKDELNQLADMFSMNLTDESTDEDIKSTLTANEGYAKMMQSVYNRAVSETSDKYKDYVPKSAEPQLKPKDATDTKTQGLTQEDILKLISEGVANGLKPYQERAEKERLNTLLTKSTKLKDVPLMFRERYSLDKEENLDSVVDKINSDWTSLKQGLVQNGIMVEAPRKSNPDDVNNDFRKMMEESSKRIVEKQAK